MPPFLQFDDPLVGLIVVGAAALVVLLIVLRVLMGWRQRRQEAQRRAELRRTASHVQLRQQEVHRLAERIVATSSTATIAGFEIKRQIEAVFAEGQRSPAEAVELLKAMGVQKGANALINLSSERLPTGKCVASGDAVIVRALETDPKPPQTRP